MNQIAAPIVDEHFVPSSQEELLLALKSWRWRLFSGQLYKIIIKENEDDEGVVLPFKPNRAQRKFISRLHHRNVILKARQLGFTTLIAILWLDHSLFVANQRCLIVAQSKEEAERLFRDKVKFAYNNLPDFLRQMMPLQKDSASELLFAHNNSSFRVAVSGRGGTYNRVHVSEMGKIAAKFPQKAIEIQSGTLPAVPEDGIAVIESTSEGQSGVFYDMASKAEQNTASEHYRSLAKKEFRLHFYPWWDNPEYAVDPRFAILTDEDHKYFASVEMEMGTTITPAQRAWYVLERDNTYAGNMELMWREMPSTIAECWQKSNEGSFFGRQVIAARKEGRICKLPLITGLPVYTWWDIGAGDGTGVWLMQYDGIQHRFLKYIQGWGEGYEYYVKELRATGYLFGVHFLPHDATHQRQLADRVGAPKDMLEKLAPDWRFEIVPRVNDLTHGINMTRSAFSEAWFDEEGCKAGITHLTQYSKKYNSRVGAYTDEPEKLTGHSEAADAFRQWAQGKDTLLTSAFLRLQQNNRNRRAQGRSRRNRPQGGLAC